MSIDNKVYRTQTYIAGAWSEDQDAIEKLYEWNDKNNLSLSFRDVHDLTSSSDDSLPCSIKASLKKRMDISKKFVLVVGSMTDDVRKGSCQYCRSYDDCKKRGKSISYDSFIDYECNMAVKAKNEGKLKIVVLYNDYDVDKTKCPKCIRHLSDVSHVAMKSVCYCDGWDYPAVKKAITED